MKVPTMVLNEIQCTVLLKIGLSPGINAFAIANELGRDQSGINRICKGLRKNGFVGATETLNIKNAPVIELRLTLLGFAFAMYLLYLEPSVHADAHVSSDYDSKITSLLQGNRDLHEGIDIFAEYFAFATEKSDTRRLTQWILRPLALTLGERVRSYESIAIEYSAAGVGKTDWNAVIHSALYKDLFFAFWNRVTLLDLFPRAPRDQGEEFFENRLLQRFKESKGWDLILEELVWREAECDRLKTLRSLVQQKD